MDVGSIDTMFHPFPSAEQADVDLRVHARATSENAYVPYSHFRVGAAVLLADGSIVTGCNVENASYGLTVCAERTALSRLVAEGHDPANIEAIAIHVDGPEGQPCGACRQFMLELAPTARVSFVTGGEYVTTTPTGLLPAGFVPAALDPR